MPALVEAGTSGPGDLIRSGQSGAWSAPATWEGGKVPAAGARVQVRAGHAVVYDVDSDAVIRSIHVAGTLAFAPDRDTRLDVGLIKIQAGDDASEDGFDCEAHQAGPVAGAAPGRALEVGTPDRPIGREHTATIRLAYVDGMDRQTCPAIVCCGGRMDFHGAPMSRTWVKLGATAPAGTRRRDPRRAGHRLAGRRPRDRHGHPGRQRHRRHPAPEDGRHRPGRRRTDGGYRTDAEPGVPVYTEERTVRAVDGDRLTLDRPARLRAPRRGRLPRRGRRT